MFVWRLHSFVLSASHEERLKKEVTMRTVYALGLAAFMAATPAMAQVVIGGGDASRHEAQAQ
jgi:Skp family chaperone for outer membrane proteins